MFRQFVLFFYITFVTDLLFLQAATILSSFNIMFWVSNRRHQGPKDSNAVFGSFKINSDFIKLIIKLSKYKNYIFI